MPHLYYPLPFPARFFRVKLAWRWVLPAFCLLQFGCVHQGRFSHQQVVLSPEQLQQALAKAPASFRDSSVTLPLGTRYYHHLLHRLFWGNHYRDIWRTPVTFPVLDLETEAGGLKVVKRGGGFQTKSLRLEDKAGNEYVLRSVDKDPATALPPLLRKTFLAGVLRDQTAAMHPYGPLVVPDLAKAAGIMYSRPKYVYVPHDPKLGDLAGVYGGMVALLESRPEEERGMAEGAEKSAEITDSQDMLRKRYASPFHVADQRLFARSRLFDMLIGDWDRHEDQWRWLASPRGKGKFYRPIPRDRDQVFYKLDDGPISWLLTRFFPLRKLVTFDKGALDVKGYAYNARFIDIRMLNGLTRADWQQIADSMQHSLTDQALEQALHKLPEPIYRKSAGRLREVLLDRRKRLPFIADRFYRLLAREPEVAGTDEPDMFVITRVNDQETLVQQYTLTSEKKPGTLVYSRTFYRQETERITLYGLRGPDRFEVSGKVKKGIEIIVVGGPGEDTFRDESRVSGWRHKTKVKDTRWGNSIETGPEARKQTSRNVKVHVYDQEGF